ncbi:cell division protein FtsZ [Buchnera aphidicola (Aphis craccivora)]|uniref:Cell division protein FtsZ n=2 Tax=cellular organisms TaxID=131567 RepID=A0A4D6XMV4_9GAMM|nr:cell division protein FtsZ [Buchnera aphidicola]QCI16467.1 cell division protein FtsZ [Buchnera aphidicola (Aphis craccivora)]QLL40605.1 cell division protein FtsZ [Buchnera aphidicola (Aphis craccivore)]WAI17977.1 MAG: cell division protein FtsZ [Buchnera aphidicola (Aphis craccivora)]
MFEPVELSNNAIIKVVGVGGGGGNAVEYMVRERIEGVEFFAINTDAQALRKIEVGQTIQIGNNITKGLGAGANPEIGRNSAEEDKELLKSALDGSDMVFIAAGMGGGTGTGAAPVVAEIAKELGILTVAVVTKPFNFEGKKRMIVADQGVIELSKYVDSLITIPNDKLLKVLSRGISLLDAFGAANNVLKGAVQGIAELITRPGLMNVDFADVRTVMMEMGYAMMGTGISSGENRAEEAAEIAISSPLLEDIDLSGARGVLVNITAGFDLKLDEFETVGNTIRSFASDNATVVIGTSLDPDMNDTLRVTVVATGIGMEKYSDINQIKNKASKEKLIDYRYQYLNMSSTNLDKKNIKNEIKETENAKRKEPEYLDIPAFLRKRSD